jgi:hypothetical protein
LTCRTEPIHFALSSVRFVSHEKLGILRVGGFASMKNPDRNFQRMHSTRALFPVQLQKLAGKRFHCAPKNVLRRNRRGDLNP